MRHVLYSLILGGSSLVAFQGVYVGGAFGGHLAETTQTTDTLGSYDRGGLIGTFSYPLDLNNGLFDHGIAGTLYAGYGWQWRSFYLAGEASVQFGSATLSVTQENSVVSVKPQLPTAFSVSSSPQSHINYRQDAIDLIPGWIPYPTTLLYGRVGVGKALTSLDMQSTNAGSLFSGQDEGSQVLSLSSKKTKTTFRAGGGLEQQIAQNLSIRADYIYTDYGSLSVSGSGTGLSTVSSGLLLTSSGTAHLYDHALLLGLTYRFCNNTPPPCWCTTCEYTGFYAGGSLGGSDLESHQNGVATVNDPLVPEQFSSTLPSQLYNNQCQGMLFFGYGSSWNRFYLGGELFAAATSNTTMENAEQVALTLLPASGTFSSLSYETEVRSSTWQYGFDLRPGFLLTPFTLLYTRVGIGTAQTRATASAFLWSDEVTSNTWRSTFRLGVGLEQLLCSRVHLRADYIFSTYGMLSLDGTTTGLDDQGNPVTLQTSLSTHLQNNAVMVGISYYFP